MLCCTSSGRQQGLRQDLARGAAVQTCELYCQVLRSGFWRPFLRTVPSISAWTEVVNRDHRFLASGYKYRWNCSPNGLSKWRIADNTYKLNPIYFMSRQLKTWSNDRARWRWDTMEDECKVPRHDEWFEVSMSIPTWRFRRPPSFIGTCTQCLDDTPSSRHTQTLIYLAQCRFAVMYASSVW